MDLIQNEDYPADSCAMSPMAFLLLLQLISCAKTNHPLGCGCCLYQHRRRHTSQCCGQVNMLTWCPDQGPNYSKGHRSDGKNRTVVLGTILGQP